MPPLCLLTLVRDVGIEPTSSRLKGECISISANPANLVGDAGIEPAWSRLRIECISHLCQSPKFGRRGGNRNHMNLVRSQVPDPLNHTPSYKMLRMGNRTKSSPFSFA